MFPIKNSRHLRKSAILVLISLKGYIRHLTDCHIAEKGSSIKYVRKIFRKTNISNLGTRGLEMLIFRKILRTYLMDGPTRRYDEMVTTDRATINLSLLPPSPRSSQYHGLRVYHQIIRWKPLSDTDLEQIQWDWKLRNDSFVSIMTDEEPGLSDLLKIVRYTCK